jgi:signal transduction histidine kinase
VSAAPVKLTTEQRIAAALQHIVYDRLPLSAALSMLVCLGFVGLLLPFFPTRVLLEWGAMIQGVGAMRLGLWYWHRRAKPPPQDATTWSLRFMLGVILAAGAWSWGTMRLMPPVGDVSMAMLVVTLLAVSSVAVSTLAAHLPSQIAFTAITLGPAGVSLIASGGPVETVVGIAILAATVALIWTGYHSNRGMRQLLATELELSESVMLAAQARATAEEANRAKSRFLATMSHEIRTPLNGVLGLAAILQGSSASVEQRRHLDLLRRSGAQLFDIVNDILDFSKIEANELEVACRPVSIRELIEDLTGPLQARIAMTDVVFETDIAANVPGSILSDGIRLRQIIGNLLSNAVKFTQKGSIRLVVDLLDGHPGGEDALLRFRVIDTGIGIPADRIGRVFDAFTQVDDSFARRAGGTGLGLAICRRLANLLGGEVGAASEPGKGSTFVFTLRSTVGSWHETVHSTTSSGRFVAASRLSGRVLLAEDNAINLEVAGAMLGMIGVTFEIAQDGQAAIDKATSGEFDLILMDCQMPGVDGYQATLELRRRELHARNGRRMPIIALTANAFQDDRQRAADAGMDAFLPKPVPLEQLYGVLARWLPRAEPADNESATAAA